jgi:hypothetical protein
VAALADNVFVGSAFVEAILVRVNLITLPGTRLYDIRFASQQRLSS